MQHQIFTISLLSENLIRSVIEEGKEGEGFLNLGALAHGIGRLKGFYDETIEWMKLDGKIANLAWDRHVHKQLNHLLIEIEEFFEAEDGEDSEELADALIVLCDLAYANGVPIFAHEVHDTDTHIQTEGIDFDAEEIYTYIADLMDTYRKQGALSAACVHQLVDGLVCLAFSFGIDLLPAFYAKCEKNLSRPQKYGTAK